MNEILQLLKTKEAKAFGGAIFLVAGLYIVSTVYKTYMTNLVLHQQVTLNKYRLAELKEQRTKAEQQKIEATKPQ